jgi:hypothetical protein
MIPYRTARVICTYICDRACPGCVNTIHPKKSVTPIGIIDMQHYDEIILTGGEPLLYVEELIELADLIHRTRLILYTSVPSYSALFAVAGFFAGITITLHDNGDADRFNRQFGSVYIGRLSNPPLFFVRVYDAVTMQVKMNPAAQYKMCKWVAPEHCKMQPNEELFRLKEVWI